MEGTEEEVLLYFVFLGIKKFICASDIFVTVSVCVGFLILKVFNYPKGSEVSF